MIELYVDKNALAVRKKELLTSGAVNVNTVQFGFSPDWKGLTKTAVFKAGSDTFSTLLTAPECFLPWEVLSVPNRTLYAGVYGTRGGELVMPTVWASLGEIQEGAKLGEDAKDPSPGVYEQITGELAGKADSIGYTESGELGLFAGDRLLKSVPVSGGGGIGIPGPEGPPGEPGADGKSAYQIAVGNGFTGTEAEWLASLKGEPGPPGENASAENIYSLEEQKIGTWIDGKTIYKQTFHTTTGDSIKSLIPLIQFPAVDSVVKISGCLTVPEGVFNIPDSMNDLVYLTQSKSIGWCGRHSAYVNKPLILTVWFTKN